MRISLVIGSYDAHGGGAERWTDTHARMLLEAGHEVHLLARRFRDAPVNATCHVVDVGMASRPRIRFGDAAQRILRDIDSDVVHDMGDGWHADLFMPHHGTRRGTFKHNTGHLPAAVQHARRFANKWVPRYREFRALERRQYDFGSGKLFLAVSHMIRDQMELYCHVPRDLIRVVYNGVDTDRFRPAPDPAARDEVRSRLGVRDETLFLIVAHNFKLKGLDFLLRAIARLHAASHGVKLVIVGDGPIAAYQGLARRLGCGKAVRFVGDQSDTTRFYQAADVFTLPTLYDPCSLVVLEAMACGLPIITSRHNGIHDLMVPGREGTILNDVSDAEALARAMEEMLDPARRAETGRAGRALAERHTIRHMLAQHIEIYREIVEARGRGPAPTAPLVETPGLYAATGARHTGAE